MTFVRKPSWAIDAIGASLVLCALVLASWFGVVQSAEARMLLKERRALISTSRETLSDLNVQRSEQQRTLADHDRVVSELGGGHENTTIEGYLETVATLSREHDVHVFQHQQLGERNYPGLRERLFSLQVRGRTENLWRLLRSIEEIDAWADVSYLKLQCGVAGEDRLALLTISMFFEEDSVSSSEKDGGHP